MVLPGASRLLKREGFLSCHTYFDTGPRILIVSPKGPHHLIPLNVYDKEETDDTDTSKSVWPACGHSGVRIPAGTDQKLFKQVMAEKGLHGVNVTCPLIYSDLEKDVPCHIV